MSKSFSVCRWITFSLESANVNSKSFHIFGHWCYTSESHFNLSINVVVCLFISLKNFNDASETVLIFGERVYGRKLKIIHYILMLCWTSKSSHFHQLLYSSKRCFSFAPIFLYFFRILTALRCLASSSVTAATWKIDQNYNFLNKCISCSCLSFLPLIYCFAVNCERM